MSHLVKILTWFKQSINGSISFSTYCKQSQPQLYQLSTMSPPKKWKNPLSAQPSPPHDVLEVPWSDVLVPHQLGRPRPWHLLRGIEGSRAGGSSEFLGTWSHRVPKESKTLPFWRLFEGFPSWSHRQVSCYGLLLHKSLWTKKEQHWLLTGTMKMFCCAGLSRTPTNSLA